MNRSILGRTQDKSLEEEVDPAHDDHLRDHHHHLRLHTGHHPIHSGGVGERVGRRAGRRVAFWGTVLQVGAVGESLGEVLGDRLVVCRRKRRVCRGCTQDLRSYKGSSARRSREDVRGYALLRERHTYCSRIAFLGSFLG